MAQSEMDRCGESQGWTTACYLKLNYMQFTVYLFLSSCVLQYIGGFFPAANILLLKL